jgi:hypothetical protein
MLDRLFLTVGDLDRAIAFHERVLPVLGSLEVVCNSWQHGS